MTSPFAKPSDLGGNGVFKPGNRMNDLAILVEPKSIERQVPNTYKGVTKHRDEVIADVSIFGTQESLDKGEPTEIVKSQKFVHGMLTSSLERILGGAMVGIVRKIPTQNGEGYVFRDVEPEVEAQVGAYYTKRAELENSAPSFED